MGQYLYQKQVQKLVLARYSSEYGIGIGARSMSGKGRVYYVAGCTDTDWSKLLFVYAGMTALIVGVKNVVWWPWTNTRRRRNSKSAGSAAAGGGEYEVLR